MDRPQYPLDRHDRMFRPLLSLWALAALMVKAPPAVAANTVRREISFMSLLRASFRLDSARVLVGSRQALLALRSDPSSGVVRQSRKHPPSPNCRDS
jgi:hypothetical protein